MGNTLQKPNESLEKKEGEEEEEGNGSSFTCEIFIEPVAANKKFKNKNLCTHPFCQECIAKYIQVKVQDDNTAKIECPGLYWFERCYCPNSNCKALVVNECETNGTLTKAQCPSCKQWFCFQCKLKWHAGYRCEESRNSRDRSDIMFCQLVERMNWARCPGCGHCVERVNGCSSVLCRCKTRFCYRCGRKLPIGCSCQRGSSYDCRITILIIVGTVVGLVGMILLGKYGKEDDITG
ncbi:RING-type domain-containing protein [Citrus sinensis]|uniref:RING-type domain-containing protein n=2 Tax=Citrus sinensis TaxID=2711 RepID=A0ACB8MBY1_CITSI|nr:RING-type domain-containing protein [Citrus sinensis]KAH9783392.1 RING-type domain-containing protein [Citrus sinensis]